MTVCDSVRTAATNLTSCDHLLCDYTHLSCLIPSIDLFPLPCIPSLSSPISHGTHPVLLPSSALCILWVYSLLSSALPQELPSYTEGVSGVSIKARTFWKPCLCAICRDLPQFIVRGAERTLKIKPFYRLLQETPKTPSSFFFLSALLWCGEKEEWKDHSVSFFSNAALLFPDCCDSLWVSCCEWRWPSFRTTSG